MRDDEDCVYLMPLARIGGKVVIAACGRDLRRIRAATCRGCKERVKKIILPFTNNKHKS